MKSRLFTVGKTKSPHFKAAIQDYFGRLKAHGSIEWIEIPSVEIAPRATPEQIQKALQQEAEKIGARLTTPGILIALGIEGKQFSSEKWAQQISRFNASGKSRMDFVIGSAHGLHASILKKADLVWSLSSLTLAHELAAVVLLEQVYRAHTILKGEPYHK